MASHSFHSTAKDAARDLLYFQRVPLCVVDAAGEAVFPPAMRAGNTTQILNGLCAGARLQAQALDHVLIIGAGEQRGSSDRRCAPARMGNDPAARAFF